MSEVLEFPGRQQQKEPSNREKVMERLRASLAFLEEHPDIEPQCAVFLMGYERDGRYTVYANGPHNSHEVGYIGISLGNAVQSEYAQPCDEE